MQTNIGTERPVEVDDAVQSLNTKRCYAVESINPETGRPNLWAHGHRPIRNANPKRYRIIERAEVAHV
jgi:hypothetical protein